MLTQSLCVPEHYLIKQFFGMNCLGVSCVFLKMVDNFKEYLAQSWALLLSPKGYQGKWGSLGTLPQKELPGRVVGWDGIPASQPREHRPTCSNFEDGNVNWFILEFLVIIEGKKLLYRIFCTEVSSNSACHNENSFNCIFLQAPLDCYLTLLFIVLT